MSTRPFTLSAEAYGVPFLLHAPSQPLLTAMAHAAPCNTTFSSNPAGHKPSFALDPYREGCALLVGDQVIAQEADASALITLLTRELMVHVANYAADRVFVHAGVVGWNGTALMLPGTSFAGKSTLVAELVRAGAVYYSDEYAVLDESGRVHPFARDLQMRRPGSPEQTPVPVQSIGGSAGTAPLPVAQVLFARYRRGARWTPRPVSPGAAALEMMRHAIPVQRTPARVMSTLASVVETAHAVQSFRGEAGPAARAILRAMDESMQAVCA